MSNPVSIWIVEPWPKTIILSLWLKQSHLWHSDHSDSEVIPLRLPRAVPADIGCHLPWGIKRSEHFDPSWNRDMNILCWWCWNLLKAHGLSAHLSYTCLTAPLLLASCWYFPDLLLCESELDLVLQSTVCIQNKSNKNVWHKCPSQQRLFQLWNKLLHQNPPTAVKDWLAAVAPKRGPASD